MMPSYVNIGAHVGHEHHGRHVGHRRLVRPDRCQRAPVGRRGHRWRARAAAGGTGDRGDDCFIGSRCIVAEGARVGRGTVLGAGCILTGTVPVIDAQTGAEVGRASCRPTAWPSPPPARGASAGHEYGLPCVLVIKHLNEGERHDKSVLNDILRDHGATI